MSETVTITMRRIDYGISWGIRFASEKPMMTIVGESAFEDGARVNDLVKKVNDRDIPATMQGIDMLRALASAGLTVTLVVERPRGTDANVVQTYSQAGLPTLPKQPIQQTCRSEENTLPVSVTSGASSLASTNVSTLGGVMSQAKPVAESDNTKRVSQFGRLNVVAAETNQECKPQMAPWAAIRLRRTIADQQPLWMMEDSYNANENNRQLAFAAVKTDSDNANSNTSQLPSPTPPSTTIPTLTRTRTPTPTPTDTVTVTATPPPPDCSKGLEDSLQQPGIGEYFCEQSFHKPPIELPKPTMPAMPAMPAPTLSMNHDAGRTLDRDFRNSSLTRRSSVTRPISSPPVPSSSGYATTSTARSVSFGVEQSQQRCSPPAGSDFALLPSEKVQEMHPMQANWSTLTPRTRPSNPPPKLVQPVRKDSTLAPPNTPPPNFRKSTPPLSAPPLSAPPLASRASLLSAATSLRCFASKIMKSEKSELIKPTRSKTTNLTSTMKASTLGVKPSIAPPKRPPPQATVLLQRSRSIESFRDDYLNGFMNPYCAE